METKHAKASRAFRTLAGAALLAAAVPTAALAEDCNELRQEMRQVVANGFGIAADYPKTHAAILGCLAGSGTDNDRIGCAAAAVVTSCTFMGADDCADLTGRWLKLRADYVAIDNAMRRQGCSR